jgi:hypothetical protein
LQGLCQLYWLKKRQIAAILALCLNVGPKDAQ